ncbi:MAG: hypothetical protein QXD60_00975 [Nanopusillaceae archaeon]
MPVQLKNNLQMVILGKHGSGKTLYGKAILTLYALRNARDYMIALSAKPDLETPHAPSQGPNYEIDLREFGFVPVRVRPGEGWGFSLLSLLSQYPRVILTEEGLSPEERAHWLHYLGRDVLELGSAVILADEAERFWPRYRCPEGMRDLLLRARWRGTDLIIIAHSDTSCAPEVLSEANAILTYGFRHATRVERLKNYVEPEALVALGPYQYLAVDDETGVRLRGSSTADLQWLWSQIRKARIMAGDRESPI